MDTLSHGLWGSGIFGRQSRQDFFLAFLFGIAPDIFSFGVYIIMAFFGLMEHPDWSSGRHPDPQQIPHFVYGLYDVSHSAVVFGIVFCFVWLIRRKPFFPLAAWGLHILLDIPTHADFFPTPFLWPLSDFVVRGIAWSNPLIFIPNMILLVVLYGSLFIVKKRSLDKKK